MPSDSSKTESDYSIRYECDHVVSTLQDGVMFDYHQTTNRTTRENLNYILGQQVTKHWRLGQCDFTRYFHYKWEDENGLVGPLHSVPEPFDEPYEWTYETQAYPWTINLVKPSQKVTCEIRYAKNMREIQRTVDPTGIVNRIYPKGYGEGVNALTIRKVNGGVPYLENKASINKYDLVPYVWVDRRFEDVASLKASAQALLNEWSIPKISYKIKAVDLSMLTGIDADKLRLGRVVRIIDPDFGTFEARIVSEKKADMVGSPGEIELEIANKTENLGTTQADLERRQEVNEVYAQGATNLLMYPYNDNADQNNAAIIRFHLPDELVRVNSLNLTFETSEFRTYGKATEGGGATSTTTRGGGGTTASSSAGGATTATSSSGGGTTATSSSGGGVSKSTASGGSATETSGSSDFADGFILTAKPESYGTPEGHMHRIQTIWLQHTHRVSIPSHTHNFNTPDHSHSVNIPSHTHSVSIPNHTHTVTIPDHTHDFTLPNHTHEINHGIFKLNRLPSRVTIKVDGRTVPHTAIRGENIDLVPYLATSGGDVTRGFHTVEITPNDLGRIDAQINLQFFIQSRGNYTL